MGYDIPEDHHQDRSLGEHGTVDQSLCTLPPEHDGACNGFMRVSCPKPNASLHRHMSFDEVCRHGTRKTLKCHQCVTDDIEDLAGPFGRKMGGGIDVVGPQPKYDMNDLVGDALQKGKEFREKLDSDAEKRQRDLDDLQRRANNANTKDSKQSNPKDAVGVRKARWFSYLPLRVMLGIGLALLEGARKYGRHNYRVAGVRASVYVDAVVCGHLMPWMEGEDVDPDTMELDAEGKPIPGTGLNHIDKALASLIVLRDGMYEGNWVDDRPPAVKEWPAFIAEYHRRAAAIIDRYKDPKAPFTHEDTVWRK